MTQWAEWVEENRKRYLAELENTSFRPQELKNYYVEYDPCLLRALTEHVLETHLIVEGAEKQKIIEKWKQRCAQLKREKVVHIFAREGLEYVAGTGQIAEIPPNIYTPLTVEERLNLMEHYLEWMKTQDGIYMLDESQLNLSKGTFVYSTVSMVYNEITFYTGAEDAAYPFLEISSEDGLI